MFRFARLCILVSVLGVAAPASASPVELQGFAGVYSSTANAVEEFSEFGSVVAEHATAPTFGARVDFWVNPRIALEFAGSYTATDLDGRAFGLQGSTGASLFFGSARILVSGAADAKGPRLHAGAGLVFASSSYDDIDGDSWVAGTATVGVRLPLSEALALRVDVDGYLYTLQWEFDGATTDTVNQLDLVLSAGLSRYFD